MNNDSEKSFPQRTIYWSRCFVQRYLRETIPSPIGTRANGILLEYIVVSALKASVKTICSPRSCTQATSSSSGCMR